MKQYPKNLLLGHILFFFIGFAPFALINALWAEVPIFSSTLPEHSAIGSTIGFWYNWCNLFPFLYVFFAGKLDEYFSSLFLFIVAVVSTFLTGLYWDLIVNNHALGVIIFSLLSGFVGCTSMVTLFTFVKKYRRVYVSAVSVGMASSGFFTSFLALIQNVGHSPKFSPFVYFSILSLVLTLSVIAMILVPLCLRKEAPVETSSALLINGDEISTSTVQLIKRALEPLLNILLISVFYYFYMPGMLPYFANSFPNSDKIYSISNTVFQVANVVGRFFPALLVLNPSYLTGICFYLFEIAFCFSVIGPRYPGIFGDHGYVVVVISALMSLFQGYIATTVYMVVDFRISSATDQKKVTKWAALLNQLGSMTGSWSCYLLTNLGVFVD
ncbi:hypothetical protein RCL1_006699 [Eukaryota sp. TZLM3-RCL]